MKIVQIAPPDICSPPVGYGGTEQIVGHLAHEFDRLGHEVVTYAPGGSTVAGTVALMCDRPLRDIPECADLEARAAMRQELARFAARHALSSDANVILNHLPDAIAPYEKLRSYHLRHGKHVPPMVTIVHGPLTRGIDPSPDVGRFISIYEKYRMHPLVTISHGQRNQHPRLGHIATIHHGIDTSMFQYAPFPASEPYLLLLAQMDKRKGADRAIEIAKQSGMKLILAGNRDTDPDGFFEKRVKPHIDGELIVYVGEVHGAQKEQLIRGATALLAPLDPKWPEPFGLHLVEAMLCGTPVIAQSNPFSATEEVIKHGKTGFVVKDIDGFVKAVDSIHTIDRRSCRTRVETLFSSERMAGDYIKLFEQLTERSTNANQAQKRAR